MYHTPSDPYRRCKPGPQRSSSSRSLPSSLSTSSLPVYSASPTDCRPRPAPLRTRSLNSTISTRPSSAASWRSNGSTLLNGSSGDISIKEDVLHRLKGSLTPAISISDSRRPSLCSLHSSSSRHSIYSSPLDYNPQQSANDFLHSLNLPTRLSNFLSHYSLFHLPHTPFRSYFVDCPSSSLPSSIPFELISTPEASPTSAQTPTTRCFWIRVPALLPSTSQCRALTGRGRRIDLVPALPALFDSSSTSIDLGEDLWDFEKLGPENDQAFWHLRIRGEEGVVLKVVFDQAFGMVGREF